jgi:multidrug resistance ABC transporter, ATP-binding and permease protein
LRNRHIILFDETTSNLDEKMALEIEKTLLTNPNLTVIMITHHLHSSVEEHLEDIINF